MNKLANFFIASQENNFRPPVLSYKAFIIYGLILLLLRIWLGTLPAQGAAVESNALMGLINSERTSRNLPGLITHSSLVKAAGEKARDMIDRDYFEHVDPDGNYVWGRIVSAGYRPYKILGENLAVDFATSEGMVKAWLSSPTHRANLLHTDFADQGLEALFGDYKGRYTNLTASLFGTLIFESKPKAQVKSEQPNYQAPYSTPYQTPYGTPYATPPANTSTPPQSPGAGSTTTIPITLETAPPQKTAEPFSPFAASRAIFTIFGLFLLGILSIDSIIIYKNEPQIARLGLARQARSHSSYHFTTFMLIILVSILIWWW